VGSAAAASAHTSTPNASPGMYSTVCYRKLVTFFLFFFGPTCNKTQKKRISVTAVAFEAYNLF
jgi:hypothetical protein